MRLSFSFLALASSILPLTSLASPEDILYIEKLNADYGILIDTRDFSASSRIFTPNATYDFGTPTFTVITGLSNIESTLAQALPNGTVTHSLIGTQSISLSGFDEHGAASSATAVIYGQTTYFGQGNATGTTSTAFLRWEDELVKGCQSPYGGWRINVRRLRLFVSTLVIMRSFNRRTVLC